MPYGRHQWQEHLAFAIAELKRYGVTELTHRFTGRSNAHIMIFFVHNGIGRTLTISGNIGALNDTRSDIRRLCGPLPEDRARRKAAGASFRRGRYPGAPQKREKNENPARRYQPRHRDEPNAMTAVLRQHFAQQVVS